MDLQDLDLDRVRATAMTWSVSKRRIAIRVLDRAGAFINAGWAKDAHAWGLDEVGRWVVVDYKDSTATRFDATGALLRALHDEPRHFRNNVLQLVTGLPNLCELAISVVASRAQLSRWNDHTATKKDVLLLFGSVRDTISRTLLKSTA